MCVMQNRAGECKLVKYAMTQKVQVPAHAAITTKKCNTRVGIIKPKHKQKTGFSGLNIAIEMNNSACVFIYLFTKNSRQFNFDLMIFVVVLYCSKSAQTVFIGFLLYTGKPDYDLKLCYMLGRMKFSL